MTLDCEARPCRGEGVCSAPPKRDHVSTPSTMPFGKDGPSMALVQCRECGNHISDRAEACPRCGWPVSGRGAVANVLRSNVQPGVRPDPPSSRGLGASTGLLLILITIGMVGGVAAWPVIRPICTIGVTGTAASVTVTGLFAGRACQQLLATGPTALYEMSQTPTQPVVCEQNVSNLRLVVRDEGILKIVGNALCGAVQQAAAGNQSFAFSSLLAQPPASQQAPRQAAPAVQTTAPVVARTSVPSTPVCVERALGHDAVVTFSGPQAHDWCRSLETSTAQAWASLSSEPGGLAEVCTVTVGGASARVRDSGGQIVGSRACTRLKELAGGAAPSQWDPPAPTSTPILVPTVVPTTGSVPPTALPSTPLDDAIAIVASKGYAAARPALNDYTRHPLHALVGTSSGSADGANQHVFFFDGDRYLGTDTLNPSAALSVVSQTDTIVIVRYRLFRPRDAQCCPSGGTADVRFSWDGQRLTPLDSIPSDDPAAPISRR